MFRYFLLSFIAAVPFPAPAQRSWHLEGLGQGTTWHITYYAADSMVSQQDILGLLSSLDSSMSLYKPYSTINRFNASDSGTVVDKNFTTVVRKALQISGESQGLFDITVEPLVRAWGFGNKPIGDLPDSSGIARILPCVGYRNLELRGNFLFKRKPCVRIDLNGIAQGYTVDLMAGMLESRGVRNYIAEIGGELRTSGIKPDGRKFSVGIETPRNNEEDVFGEVPVTKVIRPGRAAVTTSGNYRKFVEAGGKKLSHLIDPQTGYPLDNEMISATVVAKDGLTADGYDNVFMSLGLEASKIFLRSHPYLQVFLVYRRGEKTATWASPGLHALLK